MSVTVTSDPTHADQLTWRPMTMGDVPRLVPLLAAIEAVDRTGENYDADDLVEELSDDLLDLPRDTRVAVTPAGEIVCLGVVRTSRSVRDVHRVFLEGGVHPAHRGLGLGRYLLGWQEQRGAAAHRERHPQVRGELQLSPYEHVTGHCRLADRAGYAPVRWWNTMVRSSAAAPAAVPVPAGLTLRGYRDDDSDLVRRAHNAAFGEHWGSTEREPDEWRRWFTGSRAFRPDLSFVLLDGAEVVAYLLAYFYAADSAATGIREVWIGQVGTARGWRGRGAARALFSRALAEFADAGFDRAVLGVDTENVTGALRLYESLGFTVENRRVSYVKPIGSGPPAP